MMNCKLFRTFVTMKVVNILMTIFFLASCVTTHKGLVKTPDGGYIYYEERGKGDPMVLLHGHSLDCRMWDEQWKPFSKQFRVVRMDFRGYGQSSEQRENLQFCHVDDVITLMDSLHMQKAHVIGLSMGAFVAGDMLAMYTERLLTCTLASGGIRSSKGPGEPMDSLEKSQRDKEIANLKAKGVDKMKEEWTEQLMSTGGNMRERMRKPLTQMIKEWTAWQPLHKEVRLFYGKEAWAKLRERGVIDVPTLFIRGEHELKDKRFSPREAEYLQNSRIVIIPDCGHMLNMERPDEFNRSIFDFISSYQVH